MNVEEINISQVMPVSVIIGKDVESTAGENLGKIERLAIHLKSGQVAFAIVSLGNFPEIGDKLFAIPWNALSIDKNKMRIIFTISKDKLKNAPGFDENNWPDMNDSQWIAKIYRYYGYRVHW